MLSPSFTGRKALTQFGCCAILISAIVAFAFTSPTQTLAQGSNATNATNSTGAAAGGQVTVAMPPGSAGKTSGGGYDPDTVTVSPGSTIIWDNKDNALHTATSGNPDTATPDGKFDTGYVAASQTSKPITMPTEPGEYTYFCTLHPFLVGTVVVQ
jgi:plastocyanin